MSTSRVSPTSSNTLIKTPKPRIILDCDPGHDDAVAILFAAQHCEVLAITAVSGNVPLKLTQHNARLVTQLLELDLPVHAGASRPITAEALHAEFIHGESGLGGPVLPDLHYPLTSEDAVAHIIKTVREEEDVWLVPVGPLTNIALAFRTAPDIIQKIKGISLMGGGTFGNVTPMAEFNIYADPEAADIVFSSGANIIMCGLDLTHQYMVDTQTIAAIRDIGNIAATFTADLMQFFCDMYEEKFGIHAGPLHDPCAVMAITHPELFVLEPRHVTVELTGTHTRGMTVIDERRTIDAQPSNLTVAQSIDRDKAIDLLIETIKLY